MVDYQGHEIEGAVSLAQPSALVVGGSGAAGSAIVDALSSEGGWKIATLNRRPLQSYSSRSTVRQIQASLDDDVALQSSLSACRGVTHLFYAARLGAADLANEIAINTQAFERLLDGVLAASPDLRHVVLIEGTKWYGSHLGSYEVPARESQSSETPYFYHFQQAYLENVARERGLSWTAFRPHTLFGYSNRSTHNLLLLLALYASVMSERGDSIPFPGSTARYQVPTTATDTTMLGKACVWATRAAAAANEAFNINNGASLLWHDVWPVVCEFFDAALGHRATRRCKAPCRPMKTSGWKPQDDIN